MATLLDVLPAASHVCVISSREIDALHRDRRYPSACFAPNAPARSAVLGCYGLMRKRVVTLQHAPTDLQSLHVYVHGVCRVAMVSLDLWGKEGFRVLIQSYCMQ
jgi:hypothetical protein